MWNPLEMEEYSEGDEEGGQGQSVSYEGQVEKIHCSLEENKSHKLVNLICFASLWADDC